MTVETTKYIRKPLYVDAVRVTDENFLEVAEWCQGDVAQTEDYIRVRVHNPKTTRQTRAHVGDWILYTDRGYKVYQDKAFELSFDLVNPCEDAVPNPDQLTTELTEDETKGVVV